MHNPPQHVSGEVGLSDLLTRLQLMDERLSRIDGQQLSTTTQLLAAQSKLIDQQAETIRQLLLSLCKGQTVPIELDVPGEPCWRGPYVPIRGPDRTDTQAELTHLRYVVGLYRARLGADGHTDPNGKSYRRVEHVLIQTEQALYAAGEHPDKA